MLRLLLRCLLRVEEEEGEAGGETESGKDGRGEGFSLLIEAKTRSDLLLFRAGAVRKPIEARRCLISATAFLSSRSSSVAYKKDFLMSNVEGCLLAILRCLKKGKAEGMIKGDVFLAFKCLGERRAFCWLEFSSEDKRFAFFPVELLRKSGFIPAGIPLGFCCVSTGASSSSSSKASPMWPTVLDLDFISREQTEKAFCVWKDKQKVHSFFFFFSSTQHTKALERWTTGRGSSRTCVAFTHRSQRGSRRRHQETLCKRRTFS